jgi:MoaA/NifB/PqqE/SkfB family radical SAM enzyme
MAIPTAILTATAHRYRSKAMLHGWRHLSDDAKARIETGIVENRVLGGPFHAVVLPTNICNVDCFFCQSYAPAGSEILPWPVLRNFLDANAREDLRLIELTGGGEPLLYPEILALLDRCVHHGIVIEHLVTNAIPLAPLARDLAAVELDWLTISLNECDPARYGRMMKTDAHALGLAIEGVEAMLEARDSVAAAARPRIWLQLMLWKGNAAHVIEMYEFARALPVDTIFFRTIGGNRGHPKITTDELPVVHSQLREIIREDITSGENRLHFALEHEQQLHLFAREEMARHNPPASENFPDFRRAQPRNEFCFLAWFSTGIDARGTVYPWFEYHFPCNKVLGSIARDSMHAIWRGPRYRRFRGEIHELMCLGGEMEASQRFYPFLEPKCVDREGCQYSVNLATRDFYSDSQKYVPQTQRLGKLGRPFLTRRLARSCAMVRSWHEDRPSRIRKTPRLPTCRRRFVPAVMKRNGA